MKIKLLFNNRFLFNEDPEANGGGKEHTGSVLFKNVSAGLAAAGAKEESQKPVEAVKPDKETPIGEPKPLNNIDEVEESILVKALRRGSGEEEKPKGEEEPKEEEGPEDDGLVTKEGKPVSKQAAESFARIKTERDQERQRAVDLEKQIQDIKKAHEEELKKTRGELEEIDFRTSEKFKQGILAPLEQSSKEVANLVKGLKLSQEKTEEVGEAFSKMEKAIGSGSDLEFYDLVDQLADDLNLSKGASRAFALKAEKWKSDLEAYNEAQEKGSKMSSDAVERRARSNRSSGTGAIVTEVQEHAATWKAQKAEFFSKIPEELSQRFTKPVDDAIKAATLGFDEYTNTGRINKDISTLVKKGITADSVAEEARMMSHAYKDAELKITLLQKEIESYKSKLAKVGSSPAYGGFGGTGPTKGKKEIDEGKSFIGQKLKELAGE